MHVYRITQHGRDLSWQDVKRRCKELGLNHVPELAMRGYGDNELVKQIIDVAVQNFVDGPSTLDSTHIREGVCIRIESYRGVEIYKEKSYTFKVLEGIVKLDENYVDTEESA